MDNWKSRFEAVFAEINGISIPSEERKRIMREVYIASLWDTLRDLSSSYRSGMINKEEFDKYLEQLVDCQFKLEQAIEEVNFYEEF